MQNIPVVDNAMYCTSNLCETHREQNTHPHCPARRKNAIGTTHTKIHLSAPTSSARNTSFGPIPRFLDPRATRNKESDSLLEPTLAFNAHGRAKFDAAIERENLHRHARAALFRPSSEAHGRSLYGLPYSTSSLLRNALGKGWSVGWRLCSVE
jgi:hypothetical protein